MAKSNPFRKTLKQIKEMSDKIRNHPLYDHTYDYQSPNSLPNIFTELEYEEVARNVPCPMDDIEPGSIVVTEYNGLPAKWFNGNIYVRRIHLGKKE